MANTIDTNDTNDTNGTGTTRSQCIDQSYQSLSEHFEAYVDCELTGTEFVRFEAHLEECQYCERQLEQARSVAAALRALPSVVCRSEVVTATLRGIGADSTDRVLPFESARESGMISRQEAASGSRLLVWARAAAVLLAIGALAFAGMSLLEGPQPDDIAAYSQDELIRAEQDLRLALAYFGGLTQKAGLVLRDDVLAEHVLTPPLRALSKISNDSQLEYGQ